MVFLKKQFPMIIAFSVGILMLIQFFIPSKASQAFYETMNLWIPVIGGFALLLGIDSVVGTHIKKVQKLSSGYGYSLVFLISFVAMSVSWIVWGGLENTTGPFSWMFFNMFVPMGATMFSILAFYIASAAYRSFRARTPDATVLLISAVIVMLGRVPIGTWLTSSLTNTKLWWLQFPEVSGWLLNVLNAAGFRGILLGVGLGIIATSVRIIFGVEKTYMGGME